MHHDAGASSAMSTASLEGQVLACMDTAGQGSTSHNFNPFTHKDSEWAQRKLKSTEPQREHSPSRPPKPQHGKSSCACMVFADQQPCSTLALPTAAVPTIGGPAKKEKKRCRGSRGNVCLHVCMYVCMHRYTNKQTRRKTEIKAQKRERERETDRQRKTNGTRGSKERPRETLTHEPHMPFAGEMHFSMRSKERTG